MTEVAKTVTVVTRATKAMAKAASDLAKTAGDLQALTEVSSELTSEIEFKTSELNGIEAKTADQLREAKADLRLRVLENEENVLNGLLSNRDLVSIGAGELTDLESGLQAALESNEEAINAAVGKAKGMAESSKTAALKELKLQQDVETAQLKAENASLKDKNSMLATQVADMQDMLTKEREARVEMSANTSQPVVNVSSAK